MPGVERDKRKLQMSETLAIEGGRPVVDASEVQPWPILDDRLTAGICAELKLPK